jgi:hypothetical protein
MSEEEIENIEEPEVSGDKNNISFTSFREFLKFVEYIGDVVPLEFAEPIVDSAGAVLVQKSVHFRAGMLKNLWKFFNQGHLNEKIVLTGTKALRNAIREKICRALFRCLDPGRFHIAQNLVDASQINIRSMLSNIIQRVDVLPLFLKLDQLEDPILPHLGEVALVAGGFAEQFHKSSSDGKAARESVRRAIFAGLFHDIALADDDDFLVNDLEKARDSGHAAKSADVAATLIPGLDAGIDEIIREHHRDRNPYDAKSDNVPELQNIALESVVLAEYIFMQLRSQYKTDDSMNSAELLFYQLGRAFGQGKFHPRFRTIMARLWQNLFLTLRYGYEIGLVESKCPHKPSAIAYPTPRCTQVMCHKDVQTCEHYNPHFPVEILQGMRFPGRPGATIAPGKYAKCKLADLLPKAIATQSKADDWMGRGEGPAAGAPKS